MLSRKKAKRWAREELAHVTINGGYYSGYWLREKRIVVEQEVHISVRWRLLLEVSYRLYN